MAARTVLATGDGLKDAVADTEAEIFADATGTDQADKSGEKSIEEMGDGLEGDHVEDDAEAEKDGEQIEVEEKPGDTKGDEQTRDKTGKFKADDEQTNRGVPPGRLREESEKRRVAEAAAVEKDKKLDTLQREFDAFKAGITAPKSQVQEPQKAIEPPDMFADPQGWAAYQRAEMKREFETRLVEGSLADAHETHGEKFVAAYTELQRAGMAETQQFGSSPTVTRIWSATNPGKALMNWHQQQATVREVGNDPNAWLEKKLAERLADPEFLAKAVESARANARQGDNGRPRTATRMPPSLNSETGGSHQDVDPELYDASEKAVFDFATK
jgi:hypothetical protein